MAKHKSSSALDTANDRQTEHRTNLFWLLAIMVGIVLVIFSMNPFADIPRNDDFSYARTADALARTGHVAYNGWGTPLMLPQAFAGALLIRLFGFSYCVLSTMGIFSIAGVAGAMFALGRQCRLSRPAALLATVAVVGNPMALATAPTFMTDLPSLLLLLLALLALLRSFRPAASAEENSPAVLRLNRWGFALFVVLAVVAGSNRQVNWIACLAAMIPFFFNIQLWSDRAVVAVGFVLLAVAAGLLTLWGNAQLFIVPANIIVGLLVLIGYPEIALPIIYKFYVILGIFLLPFALLAVRRSDLRRLSLWILVALGMAPLAVHTNPLFSCFNPFLGLLPVGEYFTSCGTRAMYLHGSMDRETSFFPPLLVDALMIAGAVALGLSFYLLLRHVRDRKVRPDSSEPAQQRYLRTAGAALLLASLSQAVLLVPWLGIRNAFDRYYLSLLPGFALFFLMRAPLRFFRPVSSPLAGIAAAVSVVWVGGMFLVGYMFAASYLHCSAAQAALYHRLLKSGVPPEQIDNGLEIDGDTQIALRGHVNSQAMVPASAYDSTARGTNLTSPVADQFPAIHAHYIFSLDPSPITDFPLDPTPVDRASFTRLIPPYRLTVYVFTVRDAAAVSPTTGGADPAL